MVNKYNKQQEFLEDVGKLLQEGEEVSAEDKLPEDEYFDLTYDDDFEWDLDDINLEGQDLIGTPIEDNPKQEEVKVEEESEELEDLDFDLDGDLDLDLGSADLLDDTGDLSLDLDDEDLDNVIIDLDEVGEGAITTESAGLQNVAIETYEQLKFFARHYDLMRFAEVLNRYDLSNRRHIINTKLEAEYLSSLNTSKYTKEDKKNLDNWIYYVRSADSLTIHNLEFLLQLPPALRDRLEKVFTDIYLTEKIGPHDNISEESREKTLNFLNKALEEVELSIEYNKTEKATTSSIRNKQNKPKKPKDILDKLKNKDVIYGVDKIIKVENRELNDDNERKRYYKLYAVRMTVLNDSLTDDQINEKYPEQITLTFSENNSDAEMAVYIIKNDRVRSLYSQLCEKEGLEPQNYIIKPFYLAKGKLLVVFQRDYMYTDFLEKAANNLQQNSVDTTNNEWYIGVTMDSDFYSDIYEVETNESSETYITYNNDEIAEYINNFIRLSNKEALMKSISGNIKSGSIQEAKTPLREEYLELLLDYRDVMAKRTKQPPSNVSLMTVFETFKPLIVTEYLLNNLKRFRYLTRKFDPNTLFVKDALDLIILFTYGGVLAKLGITENLTVESIIQAVENDEIMSELKITDLYNIPFEGGMSYKRFKKHKHQIVCGDYTSAVLLLKTYDEQYDIKKVLKLVESNKLGKNVLDDNDDEKCGEEIMTKRENIIDSHKKAVTYIINSIFKVYNIKDEEEFAEELADIYVEGIKPTPVMNTEDAHIYLRSGYATNTELSDGAKRLQADFSNINAERIADGRGLVNTEVILEYLKSEEVLADYPNLKNIDMDKLKDSDLIKDINKLVVLIDDVVIIPNILDTVLKGIENTMIDEYQVGMLLERATIPNKNTNTPEEETILEVTPELSGEYGIKEIVNGINTLTPFTIKRDQAVLWDTFGEKIFETYKPDNPRRFKRVIKNILENTLSKNPYIPLSNEIDDLNVIGYSLKDLLNNVDFKLGLLCPSNVDLAFIKGKLKQTLYYQQSGFLNDDIKSTLHGYRYYEQDDNYMKTMSLTIMAKYIIAISEILGSNIIVPFTLKMNKQLELIKSKMEKLPPEEIGSFVPTGERRRSNALYRAYLTRQDKSILKNVNRDLVDFELLTQEPNAQGEFGGEFSKTALIDEYDLNDNLLSDDDSKDLDYFYTVLTIEQFKPNIVKELPRPIIEYMEKPRHIGEMFKNDKLLTETKFRIKVV